MRAIILILMSLAACRDLAHEDVLTEPDPKVRRSILKTFFDGSRSIAYDAALLEVVIANDPELGPWALRRLARVPAPELEPRRPGLVEWLAGHAMNDLLRTFALSELAGRFEARPQVLLRHWLAEVHRSRVSGIDVLPPHTLDGNDKGFTAAVLASGDPLGVYVTARALCRDKGDDDEPNKALFALTASALEAAQRVNVLDGTLVACADELNALARRKLVVLNARGPVVRVPAGTLKRLDEAGYTVPRPR